MSATRADVVACARAIVAAKVKWRHQGCSRRGVDCIGLVGLVAAECGLTDVWVTDASAAFKGYGRLPDPHRLYRACAEFLLPIARKDDALPGDVLLMRFEVDPQHFGILTARDPRYMAHAYTHARKVAENRIDDLWWSRVICAYRFPGIA